MLNIVLFEPEIPANTGNIGRTCVVTGTRLHLIEPLGFSLNDDMLKRAGLGYWHSLDVKTYASWGAFLQANGLRENDERFHLLTKKARKTYVQASYSDGDYLVFGKESAGLPEDLLARVPERCERIPMLADADALTDAEAWRAHEKGLGAAAHSDGGSPNSNESPLLKQDVCGNFIDSEETRISALNLSNSAAIVLYEALRQIGFPGMQV